MLKELGTRVRELREQKEIDQKSFAFYCGLGRTQLHMIENGKTNPKLLTLKKIADGLEISLPELLNIDSKPYIDSKSYN